MVLCVKLSFILCILCTHKPVLTGTCLQPVYPLTCLLFKLLPFIFVKSHPWIEKFFSHASCHKCVREPLLCISVLAGGLFVPYLSLAHWSVRPQDLSAQISKREFPWGGGSGESFEPINEQPIMLLY